MIQGSASVFGMATDYLALALVFAAVLVAIAARLYRRMGA